MKNSTIISIIIAVLIIGGAVYFKSNKDERVVPITQVVTSTSTFTVIKNDDGTTTPIPPAKVQTSSNVTIVNGVQVIEIKAKGGYSPRQSVAQAGIPTVIRFVTNNTFDCSLAVIIPSMKIREFLQQTGNVDIDLGAPSAGVLRGSCGMGMYPFEVDFK